MEQRFGVLALALSLLFSAAQAEAQASDTSAESASAVSDEVLFTDAELQTLVAPVALHPDTLLIQILVAATTPIDVVKADRLLLQNADTEAAAKEAEIKAQGYDASVEVLALAFPSIINRMAANIEWTETAGNAMLAQPDDVMAAVQVLRDQAIETGALKDTEEQVVTRDEIDDAVVIQPANPEVVYVPTYDHKVVYEDNTDAGDILMAGLITFGTIALIDDIFDDDDHWHGYWGCRNCGGWNGRPIYANPDIDIDIDGNVNIGNRVDLRDRTEFGNRNPDGSWRPRAEQRDKARTQIARREERRGATTLDMRPGGSNQDALRSKLSKQSGTRDISRDTVAGARQATKAKPSKLRNTTQNRKAVSKPKAVNRPAVKRKPAQGMNRLPKQASRKPAISKRATGQRSRAASTRGGPRRRR